MTDLVERIQQARTELVERKIALRDVENELQDAETVFVASIDYASLGKNKDARDQSFAELMRADKMLAELRDDVAACTDAKERAEVDLECLLDERRALENQTWAKLAEYLVGRVDHIHHAPEQAARQVIANETLDELDF